MKLWLLLTALHELGRVSHICNPRIRSSKQEDQKFQISLDCIVTWGQPGLPESLSQNKAPLLTILVRSLWLITMKKIIFSVIFTEAKESPPFTRLKNRQKSRFACSPKGNRTYLLGLMLWPRCSTCILSCKGRASTNGKTYITKQPSILWPAGAFSHPFLCSLLCCLCCPKEISLGSSTWIPLCCLSPAAFICLFLADFYFSSTWSFS